MSNLFDIVTQYCIEKRNSVFTEYMKKRQWNEDTIKQWELGYFPTNDLLNLKVKIKSEKLDIEDLEDAHVLSKQGVKGYTSKFFGRIIFPIRDELGNHISMTGRTLVEGEKPKYYNTEFEKGTHLYGLNFAIEEIRKRNLVYVFEGNADVITSHQNGIKNVVCVMGTAFREDHLILLSGYTSNVVLIFDNDSGGKGALASFNEKRIDDKRATGVKIYRCSLQDYKGNKFKDVDDFIRENGSKELLEFFDKSIKDSFTQKRLKAIKKEKKVVK